MRLGTKKTLSGTEEKPFGDKKKNHARYVISHPNGFIFVPKRSQMVLFLSLIHLGTEKKPLRDKKKPIGDKQKKLLEKPL